MLITPLSFRFAENEFQAISLSAPFDSLFADAFQKILLTRRSNEKCGWAAAEHYCLVPGKSKETYDNKACSKADTEEKAISGSYMVSKAWHKQ
jgi:hypothetical protein